MAAGFDVVSPADGSVVAHRDYASDDQIDLVLTKAQRALASWRAAPLKERQQAVAAFVDRAVNETAAVAEELTLQMGRPISQAPGEARGWLERGHAMIKLSDEALVPLSLDEKPGFTREMTREPLGVVLVLAPWNYPWLTAVNVVVPALLAGNVVILKHAEQTPLVAERISQAAHDVGLPAGVLQHLHVSHDQLQEIIPDPRIALVAFTGSVQGGHAVQRAAAQSLVGVTLELGGKDPAYVCADTDIANTAANIAEGAFFNAGQSCCALERLYVEATIHDVFVDALVAETEKLKLGDPRLPDTTLGPVVRTRNAQAIQTQVDAALDAGARALLDPNHFGTLPLPYLPPQILLDVTHDMDVMREETFGPVIGVMPVADDAEAIRLMNDSAYGLTASIWTPDQQRALRVGHQVDTGTFFMNRCDYLDPELAWVGIKNSGRGCSLSRLGFGQLTRPKSFHLRHG